MPLILSIVLDKGGSFMECIEDLIKSLEAIMEIDKAQRKAASNGPYWNLRPGQLLSRSYR